MVKAVQIVEIVETVEAVENVEGVQFRRQKADNRGQRRDVGGGRSGPVGLEFGGSN